MRPATVTLTGVASSASLSSASYCACSAAALLAGRKSLGKATPCARIAPSLARRSAMMVFSSTGCTEAALSFGVVMMSKLVRWWAGLANNCQTQRKIGKGSSKVNAVQLCCKPTCMSTRSRAGGLLLHALFQRCCDEIIQIAVQYRLGVAHFKVGAQILDA